MAHQLTLAQATTILRNLGWRIRNSAERTQAIRNFQAGWNLGSRLEVDGRVGPLTSAALLLSERRRRAGLGTASAHFSFAEVACRCDGRYSSCQRIFFKRITFQMLEGYRRHSGPLRLASACRCPSRNAAVGGSPTSRHVHGLAVDVPPVYYPSTVRSWRVATHIGYGRVSGRVKHIDRGSGRLTSSPLVFADGR